MLKRIMLLLLAGAVITGCETMRTNIASAMMNRHEAPPEIARLVPPSGNEMARVYHAILADYANNFVAVRGQPLDADQRQRAIDEYNANRNSFIADQVAKGASRVDALRAFQQNLQSMEDTLDTTYEVTVTPPGAEPGKSVLMADNYNEVSGNTYDYAEVTHFFPAADAASARALPSKIISQLLPMGFADQDWTVLDQASRDEELQRQLKYGRDNLEKFSRMHRKGQKWFNKPVTAQDVETAAQQVRGIEAMLGEPSAQLALNYLWESGMGQNRDVKFAEFSTKGMMQTNQLSIFLTRVVDEERARYGVESRVFITNFTK